jgi:hypothetical protein
MNWCDVTVTERCIFMQLTRVCVCVFNAFCDHCSQVKWQNLRIRQFASNFVFTLRRQLLKHGKKTNLWTVFKFTKWPEFGWGFWMFTLPKVMLDWITYEILHTLLRILQNEAVSTDQTLNQQFYTPRKGKAKIWRCMLHGRQFNVLSSLPRILVLSKHFIIPYILEHNLHPNLICTQFLAIS